MKRIPIIGLVLISMIGVVLAQKLERDDASRSADAASLKQLVRDWASAIVTADIERLEKVEANDFKGSAGGVSFDGRMLHEALKSGTMKVQSWTIDDVRVNVRGKSAVVSGHSTLTGASYLGTDFSGGWDFTDRFVKQKDGSWRAVSSQARRIRQNGGGDEDSLKQLVQEWANAVVRGDLERLEKIHGENFSAVAEGMRFDKRMLHDALKSGKMKVGSWTIEDVQVSIAGNSAVVTGHSTLTHASYMGTDFSGAWEWTDRFVKQKDGRWRAVSSQARRTRK